MSPTVPPRAWPFHDANPSGWIDASAPEAGRLACGGGRMCVSLRETVGDRDVDDEATWTYLRRVSRRDTHIRCAPSRKRGFRFAHKAPSTHARDRKSTRLHSSH